MAFDLVPINKNAVIPPEQLPDPEMALITTFQDGTPTREAKRKDTNAPAVSFCTGNHTWFAIWDWVVTTYGIFTDSEKSRGYRNSDMLVTSIQALALAKEMESYVAGGGKFIRTFGDGGQKTVEEALGDPFVQTVITFIKTSGGFEIK